tara:strand:+ start:8540 stop:9145 length:606 start_codon:yes stop_codon:yes gene_type:complete
MSQIKLLHSGGNGVILAAPSSNPAADRTLRLPGDADGTIATTANAGKILQVIQTVKKNRQTINSTTLVDITGMSVSITPSSASNKVLVNYSLVVFSNAVYYALRLLRDSDSTIFIGDENPSATSQNRASFGSYDSSYVIADTIAQSFLDSPNTTSAITYKLQAYSPYSSAYTIGINSGVVLDNYSYMNNCVSTITAMEVAA